MFPAIVLVMPLYTLFSQLGVRKSIFGLLIFVFVKNYIKSKINYYLNEKNKKKLK